MRRTLSTPLAAILAATISLGCSGEAPSADGASSGTSSPTTAAPPERPVQVVRGGDTREMRPSEFWNSSTVYFLLTDRFHNGDPGNDDAAGRDGAPAAVLRGFEGGDLAGLTAKIEEGWFDALGVDAIWLTPFVEQIRGSVDEGTGRSYGFHGYWTRDWTAVEPNLGTEADLRRMVEAAHDRGIRVIMDAVIQHTGPVTEFDPVWPSDWVRTGPACSYRSYETTVECTLVENLPDILTASDAEVDLPPPLVEKWRTEGRLEQELAELDAWFAETGHPRAPRYYLMKWLSDWVREFGFDGWRVDTVKHFQESVSAELAREGERAFEDWKAANPDAVLDELPFWMLGEVYNYSVRNDRIFVMDGGAPEIDYFEHGYDALINFDFRNRDRTLPELYAEYAAKLEGPMKGVSFMNYVSSHDDGTPWDRERAEPVRAGTRLLLAPGGAQVYYGDEIARPLEIEGASGDANLRSPMEWESIGPAEREVLDHWRMLGTFRRAHPSIGAGSHATLSTEPFVFGRALGDDAVVVGIDLPAGPKTLPVEGVFEDGATLRDAASDSYVTVVEGVVALDTPGSLVLLERTPG